MPSKSAFSLSLVDAASHDPLPEYRAADGSWWVRGDAGGEFFVVIGSEVTDSILCTVAVDGKDIGYHWITHRPNTSAPLGPLKGGQMLSPDATDMVTHAFRFVEVEANALAALPAAT